MFGSPGITLLIGLGPGGQRTVWVRRKEYNLLMELKQAAEHKAHFFEQLNTQLSRENRRLIERLLAKADVPLVESPDNIIENVLKATKQEYKEEFNGDMFEDDADSGEPIFKDANEQRAASQESDKMEMQP